MSDATPPNGASDEGASPPTGNGQQSPRTPAAAVPPRPAGPVVGQLGQQQKVRFDSANIKSTYCNVCNATSTREEVVINFGINNNWDKGGEEMEVLLEHRVILSPFAAKRLHDLLARLITEHEQRYGKLN